MTTYKNSMVVGASPRIYNHRMDVFDFKRVMFEHYTGETPLEMVIRYNTILL